MSQKSEGQAASGSLCCGPARGKCSWNPSGIVGRQARPELAASSFQLPAGSMYGCSRGSSPGMHERSKEVEGNDFSPGEQLVSLEGRTSGHRGDCTKVTEGASECP